MELKQELDQQIKTLDGEIIRACNEFERVTGLMITNIHVSSHRGEDNQLLNIGTSFIPYPGVNNAE